MTVILCYYIDMTSEVINRKRGFIMNIALMAHDSKKELMTQFCIAYCGILRHRHYGQARSRGNRT